MIGMGRFYLPESKPDKPEDTSGQVGPEGRFYLPPTEAPEDDAPAEGVDFEAEGPVEQASVLAGDPPSTDGDEEETEVESDPAAETLQEDPNEAASLLAGDPPEESVQSEQPAGNASRDEWAEYARTQGASDADLVDEDGKDLGRDTLREKYGSTRS